MYKNIIRPILFLINPESVHHFSMTLLKYLLIIPGFKFLLRKKYGNQGSFNINILGLSFKNNIGLAAGFDKDGKYLSQMSHFGFGYIEVGTVTPKPQIGNPKQRLFRLPKDKCLINRMGFNNDGVDALVERLKKLKDRDYILGGNIGKNKTTPNENAVDDYVICFNKLFEHVDYFVVNVSSPNTPGLRSLQEKGPLEHILNSLSDINYSHQEPKPILLKIAPDLEWSQIDDIVEIVSETKIQGIIAGNTTISRDNLKTSEEEITKIGNGGLSGPVLKDRSNAIIKYLRSKLDKDFVIIGVGGISTKKDKEDKLNSGADLVQVFTGFIYEGPSLVKKLL